MNKLIILQQSYFWQVLALELFQCNNVLSQDGVLSFMTKLIFRDKCYYNSAVSMLVFVISCSFQGAKPEIVQGRGGFVELGHFYKPFLKKRLRWEKFSSFFS